MSQCVVGLSLEWLFSDTGFIIHWSQGLVTELDLLAADREDNKTS